MKLKTKCLAFALLGFLAGGSGKAIYDANRYEFTPSKYDHIQDQIEKQGLAADSSKALGALAALMILADGKVDSPESIIVEQLQQDPTKALATCVESGSPEEIAIKEIDSARFNEGYSAFSKLLLEFAGEGVTISSDDMGYLVGGLVAMSGQSVTPKLAIALIKAASGPVSCVAPKEKLRISVDAVE